MKLNDKLCVFIYNNIRNYFYLHIVSGWYKVYETINDTKPLFNSKT